MINLFDMSTAMTGAKKGSIECRNRPAAANKANDPVKTLPEDKRGTIESRKASHVKKSSPTPMKTLIAQEMSKETIYRPRAPNVIARLMGLDDALPGDPSFVPAHSETRGFQDNQQLQTRCIDRSKPRDLQSHRNDSKDYKDVYEIRQPQKCRHDENLNEKRVAVVREKFMEAKRLAKDEKLLDSKEFHDALEVLSSNRDLFLKFLEEPDSIFSTNLEEHRSIPSPPQAKRIIVLKPSKPAEAKPTQMEQHYNTGSESQNAFWNMSFAHQPMTEKLPHPTRIVVLKPNPRKQLDIKPTVTPGLSSSDLQSKGDHYKGLKESLSKHRRDESLLSSVFSNGYVGDDSSFHLSDSYVEGYDCNNISDSEISTSWDNTSNRCGSPYSHSSLSRTSFSPESSSVIKEAKKRLSERWALVASNQLYQEKLRGRRSSGTLGEILTVNQPDADVKDKFGYGTVREEELGISTASSSTSVANFSRSKSVPTSSTMYESFGSIEQGSDFQSDKSMVLKGTEKSSNGKTSFKGRVSSLFFFKNKKSSRDQSVSSLLESSTNALQRVSPVDNLHDSSSPIANFMADSYSSSSVGLNDSSNDIKVSCKTSLSHEDMQPSIQDTKITTLLEKPTENQDHPSPTSTLDAPFKDDTSEVGPNGDNPQTLSRSPPIESIARTLSWSDSVLKSPLPASSELSRVFSAGEKDPHELILVQNLLKASGLNKNLRSAVFNGWHSPEVPLDPKLLDKLPDGMEEVINIREMRSNQKLIFDCVNAVLREIGHSAEQSAHHPAKIRSLEEDDLTLDGQVWLVVKKMLADAEISLSTVDRLLNHEIDGIGWSESMKSERTTIGKDVSSHILDELVEDAVVEFADC